MTNDAHWPAIYRGKTPVDISVVIPGSKSVTNRALILAAQAKSPSVLRRPLVSRDSELMVEGLKALGIGIEEKFVVIDGNEELQWIISPAAMHGGVRVDVGNAGTVMRFLPPLAALAKGDVIFDGDPRSYERPLAPVIKALEDLGVKIDHENRYSLPLKLTGNGSIPGGKLSIDASESSQFLSALLLVAPSFTNGIVVNHHGHSLPSMPHIEMTVDMLREFGAVVEVDHEKSKWHVYQGELHGLDLVIEPDLSNAAPFMAAAMVCGGSIEILDWPKSTTQPGDQLRNIFASMGAKIEQTTAGLKISGANTINGIDIDLHDVGELTPSIAAVAALASSQSTLRGIAHLRLHETDRLAALANEINNLGGDVTEGPGELLIKPAKLVASQIFRTYEDHRMATAGAIIGLAVKDLIVENIETTKKTLPDFPGMWREMLNGK